MTMSPSPAALKSSTPPAEEDTRLLFPIFLKLTGRRVVVVGGGPVAAAKIGGLRGTGAEILVVAPDVRREIAQAAAAGELTLAPRAFEPADLAGAALVIAAAPPEINRQVAQAAEQGERPVFVVAVDDPRSASAYGGGVIRRDGVTVAVSTDGRAPALAGLLREAFEAVIPDDLGAWVEQARALRAGWRASAVPMAQRRPLLLQALNRLYEGRT
jgi:siroheme synthase-like protein